MTKKRGLLFSVLILVLLGIITTVGYIKKQDQSEALADTYHYEVFETPEGGWGYKIFHGESPIITQSVIPAIGANRPFPNKESAEETAKLVLEKISLDEWPSITPEEMRNILKEKGE